MVKRVVLGSLLVGSIIGLLMGKPAKASASVNDFTITSFTTDYYLSKDSSNVAQLKVVEHITALFPTTDQNHGIERALPQKYKGNSLALHVESVKKASGQDWQYTTYKSNDNLVLRIGDANQYVHGSQDYVITYTEKNVVSFTTDSKVDEFYWDVNGTVSQSQQTMNYVSATIHYDSSIASSKTNQQKCFTGSYGTKASDCDIEAMDDGNNSVTFVQSSKPLGPGQTLSFVVGFNQGTFSPAPTNWTAIMLVILAIIIFIIIPPLVALIIMFSRWRKSGRDAKGKGVIVPQYEPLKGTNVLVDDMTLHNQLSNKAITAAILQLCIFGYLKVYEVKKDKLLGSKTEYEIELTKKPDDLSAEMHKIIEILFGNPTDIGQRVNLNDEKNKLHPSVEKLKKLTEKSVISHGYYLVAPAKAKKTYSTIGGTMLAIGMFLSFMPFLRLMPLGLVFAGIIVMIFGNLMPARTQKGADAKDYILGLEQYMKLAEADRIKTLQSPQGAEKTPVDTNNKTELVKLYEKLLPYAVIFGIEKQWAAELAPLYQEPPSWYTGNQAFNTALFASTISSLNTATMSSFAPPSSSGSSGFGGGGFAGGGGGGGGVGGW